MVQAGHGRVELAETALKQAQELAFFPVWSYAHPKAVELAERLADEAPGDLNKVFFTTGGGEAVETAWKLAKQYFKLVGKPTKHKVISRAVAYHGTPQGALSITGLPALKAPFEPLVPGAHKVPNTNIYRAPILGDDPEAFGRWAADQIEQQILFEGPDTVAAVFLEPVQNAGGCFPPPPGYFQRVREICDQYDVLLVSDEVICAFGRLGTTFACDKFGYVPDMITCAKGMTSGYSPIGACIVSDRLAEPFYQGDNTFLHGYTFGGHPVSAAVGLANLDLFEREGLNQHVLDNEGAFRATLEKLHDLPIVGDVRGNGFFYGIELVKDKDDQGVLQRRGDRARPVRLPLQGPLRERPVLPCRRPRRPGHPARPAADLQPGDVRRDRADPARDPVGGVDQAVASVGSTERPTFRRYDGGGAPVRVRRVHPRRVLSGVPVPDP